MSIENMEKIASEGIKQYLADIEEETLEDGETVVIVCKDGTVIVEFEGGKLSVLYNLNPPVMFTDRSIEEESPREEE